MTTPYRPHNGPGHLFDLIDKHVSYGNAALQEHYQKAAETRALLKKLGCWPSKPARYPEHRGKKPRNGPRPCDLGREAYEWGRANDATYVQAAERFKIDANSIHSYRQYRKLPKLRTK